MGKLQRLEQHKAALELADRLAQIAKAKDAEIAMLKARVNELEEKLGLAVGSCESSLDYLRNIPHDVLQAAEDRSFLERENEELRERAEKAEAQNERLLDLSFKAKGQRDAMIARAEKAEAERDLYQGCCTRAFDEWLKLHPEGKVWPDGAVQLVELLKAKDAQIEELYGRITGLEMSWAEEVQAKDAEIADVTSQRELLQRSYDSCNEKAEARVKELEGLRDGLCGQLERVRPLVRLILGRRELEQCWFVDAEGDTGDCAYGDHCNPHCPLYKLAELVR